MVADILKVDHGEIKSRTPLMDLGFDSQTALTLRQRLGSTLQREFSPTLLFNYPTIKALVGHILGVDAPKLSLAFRSDTVNESIAVIVNRRIRHVHVFVHQRIEPHTINEHELDPRV